MDVNTYRNDFGSAYNFDIAPGDDLMELIEWCRERSHVRIDNSWMFPDIWKRFRLCFIVIPEQHQDDILYLIFRWGLVRAKGIDDYRE